MARALRLRLRLHDMQLSPISTQITVWIEVRVIAHHTLVGFVESRVIELVAQLKRRARGWIAKSLHFLDQLTLPIGRLHCSACLV
jgi:hypothetical protein